MQFQQLSYMLNKTYHISIIFYNYQKYKAIYAYIYGISIHMR
jgi:hypothetical protein